MTGTLGRTLRGLREHTYLFVVSSSVIAAALVLVGMFAMVSTNLARVLGAWERDAHVSAYLPPAAAPDAHDVLLRGVLARPEVLTATYVSSADAQRWMQERMPELGPVLDDLGPDTLPASIEITLRPEETRPERMATFVASLSSTGSFAEVDYGRDWIERVDSFLSVIDGLSVALGGLIAVAALFLVGNTIHLVVYARRDELEIMRLVGASDGYILAPFLLEGALQGVLAGSIAAGLLWAAHHALLSRLGNVVLLAFGSEGLVFLPPLAVAGLFLGGVSLGSFASWGAVRRFLSRIP